MSTVLKIKKAKPLPKIKSSKKPSPIAVGFDISLSSIAGCVKMYDSTLDKMRGPAWIMKRWQKDVPHFEKLSELAKAHNFVFDLVVQVGGIIRDSDYLYIGVEELPKRVLNSQRAHQQAELIGAFVGGLLRYGWTHVLFVNIKSWQSLVANDLEVKVNKDFDKWTVKNWAREVYGAPKWPDLIRSGKLGLIPKPKGSKAMPEQPDDRYDSTGIMDWVWEQIEI